VVGDERTWQLLLETELGSVRRRTEERRAFEQIVDAAWAIEGLDKVGTQSEVTCGGGWCDMASEGTSWTVTRTGRKR
jgi:hypothetical protein